MWAEYPPCYITENHLWGNSPQPWSCRQTTCEGLACSYKSSFHWLAGSSIHHRQHGYICDLSAKCRDGCVRVCLRVRVHVWLCTFVQYMCVCGNWVLLEGCCSLLAGEGFNWNTLWMVWILVSQWRLQTHSPTWVATVSWGAGDYQGVHNFKQLCILTSVHPAPPAPPT